MPFNIWIARAPDLDGAKDVQAGQSIKQSEYDAAFEHDRQATSVADLVSWLQTKGGLPCASAYCHDGGAVVVSVSYSNASFQDALVSALGISCGLAEQWRARAFIEMDGQELTLQRVKEVYNAVNPLALKTFRETLGVLHAEGKAPLEYPVLHYDVVSEFFFFHLVPRESAALADLVAPLSKIPTASVRDLGEGLHIEAPQAGKMVPVAKVARFPDGRIQLSPFHGSATFPMKAMLIFEAARLLNATLGGEVRFNHQPFTPDPAAFIQKRWNGTGAKFFLDLHQEKGEPFY